VSHPKREARERALELLYEAEAKTSHPAEVIAGLPVEPAAYAATLTEGVGDHLDLLDHVIGARARGWTVKRMPAVDRALLRLATFELAFRAELPTPVVIDEAVELARTFSTDASPSFVNGVLSAVVKDVRGGGPWAAAHRPTVLVLDCDGVVRHYDLAATAVAEEALGLEPGAVHRVALDPALLSPAMLGELDVDEWAAEIGRRVRAEHGVDADAVTRLWVEAAWHVDGAVVELVRAVQATGAATACFSNATRRLEDDLASAGVADAFDVVVNSSRIGVAKPDEAAYLAACASLGAEPADVLFVDDRGENVVAALAAGIHGVRYQGVDRLRAVLVRTGLLPG
jgi:putative hydrolase of the HAD superfamily